MYFLVSPHTSDLETRSAGLRMTGVVKLNTHTHTHARQTSPKQEVKPAPRPVSICVAFQSRRPDQLVSIALVQDDRNGLLAAHLLGQQ